MTIRPSLHNVPSFPATSPSPSISSLPVLFESSPEILDLCGSSLCQGAEGNQNAVRSVLQKECFSSSPSLVTASRVVVGGRGAGDKKQFEVLFKLADKLGAAGLLKWVSCFVVGGTRAAVDQGMIDPSLQVGQTGKIIRPALYVGCGVSGSIQHQAGMKESQTIVCINKDPEAPLFKVGTKKGRGV